MALPFHSIINPFKREKHLYTMLIVLVVLAGGVFGTMKGREFFGMRQSLTAMAASIQNAQADAAKAQKNLEDTGKKLSPDQALFEKSAFQILPNDEEHLQFTKELDSFFERNFQTGSEIVASNLRFGTTTKDPNKPYSILPVSLTITASSEKFQKFLDFIEHSGSFDTGTRLLDLQSIRMSFNAADKTQQVAFSVELRAFFRNPTGAHGGNQ